MHDTGHVDPRPQRLLQGVEGEVRVGMKDGVEYLLRFGNGVAVSKADASKTAEAGGGSATGRYLFVKDSYSSTDVAATLSELDDTAGIEYSHTPFDELVTKQVINYERHPADSRYVSSYTYTNTTARTNWNIQTLENVETVNLDMLTGAVDTWAGIRDRIFGDLKRIITCDIVNPRYFILEIGDVIQLTDDTRYFMITDERRTPGRLNITAREVYA